MNGPCAHGARLCTGVEGIVYQLLWSKVLGGESHQIGFGVAGTITLGDDRILRLEENMVMVVHEQCAKGVIAMGTSLPGQCNGRTEILNIDIVHERTPSSLKRVARWYLSEPLLS